MVDYVVCAYMIYYILETHSTLHIILYGLIFQLNFDMKFKTHCVLWKTTEAIHHILTKVGYGGLLQSFLSHCCQAITVSIICSDSSNLSLIITERIWLPLMILELYYMCCFT